MAKYTLEFDDKLCILFKYYWGEISLRDISASWNEIISNRLIPENTRGFILDYRNAHFNVNLEEYEAIPDFYRQHAVVFGGYRIAILTESPQDIVIPVLVHEKDYGYESQPFSTIEAAIHWVLAM